MVVEAAVVDRSLALLFRFHSVGMMVCFLYFHSWVSPIVASGSLDPLVGSFFRIGGFFTPKVLSIQLWKVDVLSGYRLSFRYRYGDSSRRTVLYCRDIEGLSLNR